jgi:signal transduction histidine kinase
VTLLLFPVTRTERSARVRAERAARRTAFLADAGQALSSSLEYRRTLSQVAQLAAARVTDVCVIHVRERAAPLWAAAHRDAEVTSRLLAALEGSALHEDVELGPGAALATGAPRVRNDLDLDRLTFAAKAPELARLFRELRVRATLTVPLFARGEPLGAITFAALSGRIGRDDVSLAADLGRLVTAAVDTARLYARAQAAIRQRDEFLSVASHELRTPLTSLTLQSESLRAKAARAGAPDLAGKADVIRRSVERLTRLVSSLLDLSRITAGRLDLELEEVDLSALVREVAERFAEEARRSGCELVVDAPAPVVGRWDRLRLDQVATNLVSNAIKYGPGQPVEIRVSAAGGRALLSVRDRGIGISPSDQARIFERFERAVSDRNYGGFGLGLWIVRRVVEALGGSVRVESAPGEGATFVVELEGGGTGAPPGDVGEAASRPRPA